MAEGNERRYSGRSVQEWKDARRERLLDAGLALFGSEGYQGTSIERLCSTAKVSTRHFYQEFPNKEAVLLAVHEQGVQLGLGKALEALTTAEESIDVRLVDALRAYLHTIITDPRRGRIAFVEVVGVSPAAELRRREFREAIVAVIEEEGNAAVARGEMPPQDFRHLAIALVGAVNGVIYDWMFEDPRPPAEELEAALSTLALRIFGLA
ncbi:TetR/AcrR family transcriptional regulator [Nocardioides speluncae]|uniref:TetR/AcrR family transcriptional regulator n=1 Tax=Nocardioides speluncae TaxID=2670337 RepID=UPI000D688269|nr:TetR/AcrR family transcriptional regulator [Nocardioides speluncae]